MTFETKTVPPDNWLVASKRLRIPEIPAFAGEVIDELMHKAGDLGIAPGGPPVFCYFGIDGKPETEFLLKVAVAVSDLKGDPAPYEFLRAQPFKCIAASYKGSMRGIGPAWGEVIAHVKGNGLRHSGEDREVYLKWVDFDSAENVTELQAGIA